MRLLLSVLAMPVIWCGRSVWPGMVAPSGPILIWFGVRWSSAFGSCVICCRCSRALPTVATSPFSSGSVSTRSCSMALLLKKPLSSTCRLVTSAICCRRLSRADLTTREKCTLGSTVAPGST